MQQRLRERTSGQEDLGEALLPLPAGRWLADPGGSGVCFVVRQLGLFNAAGCFTRFDATLDIGRTLDDVRIHAEVDLSSIGTNNVRRDDHLRAGGLFVPGPRSTMAFHSTSVVNIGGDSYRLNGDLTIAGISRAVIFHVEFDGSVCSVDQRLHAGFRAAGVVRRSDFGVDLGLGAANVLVGDKVDIGIGLLFTSSQSASRSARHRAMR